MKRIRTVGFLFQGVNYDLASRQHWYQSADSLEHAFEVLMERVRSGSSKQRRIARADQKRLEDDPTASPVFDAETSAQLSSAFRDFNLIRPAAMLAAMAVEAYLKGAIAAQTQKPPPSGHKLAAYCGQVGLQLSRDDSAVVDQLTRMLQLGRYHMTQETRYAKSLSGFDLSERSIRLFLAKLKKHLEGLETPALPPL